MLRRTSRPRDERGAIAVIFALCALTLMITAGLVVDLGLARDTRRQSQNAADASALAAANVLNPTSGACTSGPATPPCVTDAVNAAQSYAVANFGVDAAEWATCPAAPSGFVVPPGAPTCISFDSLTAPTKVWVVMPTRTVATTFGALADVSGVDVTARARATVGGSSMSLCGLCMLGTGNHYIQTGNLTVSNTSVHVNGSLGTQQNNGFVTVTNGTVNAEGTISGNVTSQQNTPSGGTVFDPLAGFDLPSTTNAWHGTPVGAKSNPCSQGPGFYNSISLTGNSGPCTLTAGTYVITGSLSVAGQRTVVATSGVTLYFTCGTATAPRACSVGEAGGSMTFPGQGGLSISPPTSGPLQGLSIASDRNNTSTLDFRGNGAGSIRGTIYAASGSVGYRGNGAGTTDSLVVVRDLYFNGNNSALSLVYTSGNNVRLPPRDPALDQ